MRHRNSVRISTRKLIMQICEQNLKIHCINKQRKHRRSISANRTHRQIHFWRCGRYAIRERQLYIYIPLSRDCLSRLVVIDFWWSFAFRDGQAKCLAPTCSSYLHMHWPGEWNLQRIFQPPAVSRVGGSRIYTHMYVYKLMARCCCAGRASECSQLLSLFWGRLSLWLYCMHACCRRLSHIQNKYIRAWR